MTINIIILIVSVFKLHSEISKNEDTLKEYMLYKQFLDSLTPQVHVTFPDLHVL